MARNAYQHIATGPPVDLPGFAPLSGYQGPMSLVYLFREDVLSGLLASGSLGFTWIRANDGSGPHLQVVFQRDTGDNIQVGLYDEDGATVYGQTAANFFDITTMVSGAWYTLLLTHDGTTGTGFNAYIFNADGTSFDSETGITSIALPTLAATPQVFLFRGNTSFDASMVQANGLFDSIAFWTKVISADEALGFPEGSESNLVYAFAFDEDPGATSVPNYVTANDDLSLSGMTEGVDFDWSVAPTGAIHPDILQNNVRLYDDDALPDTATSVSTENQATVSTIAAADIHQFLANFSRVDDVGSIGLYFSTDSGSTWTAVGASTTVQYGDSPNVPAGSNTASAVLTAVSGLSLDTANSDWRDDQSTHSVTGVADTDYIELGRAVQYASGTGGGNNAVLSWRRSADLPITAANTLEIAVTTTASVSVNISAGGGMAQIRVGSAREGNLRFYFDALETFSGEKGAEGAAYDRRAPVIRVVGSASLQTASGVAKLIGSMLGVSVTGMKAGEGSIVFASSGGNLYLAATLVETGEWVEISFKVPKNWIQIDA